MRRTLLGCGLVLLVLAGCSGDDDEAATTTSAPAGTAATGPTTTIRPVDTSFTGQNSTQFCTLARTYNERFTSVGANPTPAQLRTVAREGQTAIAEARTSAPAEIRRDVEVLAAAFGSFLTELEKVNFEVSRLPPSALAQLQAPEFQQSTMRFEAYIRNVCRIPG